MDYNLPHEDIITAETGNVIKRKEPALSKIYTYPVDKNVKFYKPFVDYSSEDQDEYFFKYEYIRLIENQLKNLEENLAVEQLENAIKNEMEMNDLKAEDRKLHELVGFFDRSLFTSIIQEVKTNYLKQQAEKLMLNNTTLIDSKNRIADIRIADIQTLNIMKDNTDIEKEINLINYRMKTYVNELEKDNDLETLDKIKDLLVVFNRKVSRPIYEDRDEEQINETFNEVGNLQKSEIFELYDKMNDISNEKLFKKEEEQKFLKEKRDDLIESEKEFIKKVKLSKEERAVLQEKKDIISQEKKLNEVFTKRVKQIKHDLKLFTKRTASPKKQTKEMLQNIILARSLEYLTAEEYDLITNNFPSLRKATDPIRNAIRSNINDLLNSLRKGEKIDLETFMTNIKIPNLIDGLEKTNFTPTYTNESLDVMLNNLQDFKETKIGDLNIDNIDDFLEKSELVVNQAEQFLNTDRNTLIVPTGLISEGALYSDLPPTTELTTPMIQEEEFEEEGSAPTKEQILSQAPTAPPSFQ